MSGMSKRPRFSVPSIVGVVLVALLVTIAGEAIASPLFRVIREGDCLSEIAQEYSVSVEQLRRWNSLRGDVIQVGQRLIVGYRGSKGKRGSTTRGPVTPRNYTVASGDTLSEIAARHGVNVQQIIDLNPGLEANHIEVGQGLRIPRGVSRAKARPRRHVIRRGETLSRIAHRYGVDVDDILRWNRGLRANRLSVGHRLMIHPRRLPSSQSIGRTYAGRLENARRLQPHKLFIVRNASKAWGTEETIRWIHDGFDVVQRRHSRAKRVRVHDLSYRDGGPISGHRSHESGRDADVTYFQKRCPRSGCQLRNVQPRELDVAPQWTLFRQWIRSGRAQVIFVDYDLQAVLYRHAQRHGATRSQLRAWFQYPRGRRGAGGIIRHFANHRNHFHIRFVCPRGDGECLY